MGKILNIFTSKINTFLHIIDPFWHVMNMMTHLFVVLYYLFAIGNWAIVLVSLYFMYLITIKLGAPYMKSD